MPTLSHPDFPNSLGSPFGITSPKDKFYNCIAYVYGDYRRWYWPSSFLVPPYFWPPAIPRVVHVNSFIQLYSSIGYQVCQHGDLQAGVEKLAIFGFDALRPKHAALQLVDGNWSSKLGENHDVSHSIQNISGGTYGNVLAYMSRARI